MFLQTGDYNFKARNIDQLYIFFGRVSVNVT